MNFSERQELLELPGRISDLIKNHEEHLAALEERLKNLRRHCDHRFETGSDARVFEEHVTYCKICGLELWRDTMGVHKDD